MQLPLRSSRGLSKHIFFHEHLTLLLLLHSTDVVVQVVVYIIGAHHVFVCKGLLPIEAVFFPVSFVLSQLSRDWAFTMLCSNYF